MWKHLAISFSLVFAETTLGIFYYWSHDISVFAVRLFKSVV
jgi:hypothetical protein